MAPVGGQITSVMCQFWERLFAFVTSDDNIDININIKVLRLCMCGGNSQQQGISKGQCVTK